MAVQHNRFYVVEFLEFSSERKKLSLRIIFKLDWRTAVLEHCLYVDVISGYGWEDLKNIFLVYTLATLGEVCSFLQDVITFSKVKTYLSKK